MKLLPTLCGWVHGHGLSHLVHRELKAAPTHRRLDPSMAYQDPEPSGFLVFSLLFCFCGAGIKPRASCVLGK